MTYTETNTGEMAWHIPHGMIRADSYVLLASMLTCPPKKELLDLVKSLEWQEGLEEDLTEALVKLREAGITSQLDDIAREYDRLFVGLGCGELIPYGSWYQQKMIQSEPLAAIRNDIARLGIVRQSGGFESEDHAGALCEIMALLCLRGNEDAELEQANFFFTHLGPWLDRFFHDMQKAGKITFYRAVGNFGSCFLQGESRYLQHLTRC